MLTITAVLMFVASATRASRRADVPMGLVWLTAAGMILTERLWLL